MHWRLWGFYIAAGIIVGRLLCRWTGWFHSTSKEKPIEKWSWGKLILASFLTLFAELALIRWIGTEVRVFAYVKNLALLICFLGFGLGCALARYPRRWWPAATALLGLVMVVRIPWHGEQAFEGLSRALGGAQDIEVWAANTARDWPHFLLALAMTGVLLLLVAFVFIPLGQEVSAQLEFAERPLRAYSWNLAGSLLGIVCFFGVSWFGFPPALWIAIIFVGIVLLQSGLRRGLGLACLVIPSVLLLHDVNTPAHFTVWTPYQQIEVSKHYFNGGEFEWALIQVNHAPDIRRS